MLIIRRHAQVIMTNAYNDLQNCLSQTDSINNLAQVSSDKIDKQKYDCVMKYKLKMSENIPFVE